MWPATTRRNLSALLDWGLRLCMLFGDAGGGGAGGALVPAWWPLCLCIKNFTLNDAVMTQNALIAYSFGLIGLILIKVLAPGFDARQNMKRR